MLLRGKPVADNIREKIACEIREIKAKCPDNAPKLAIMRVGDKPDDISYENMLVKSCGTLGIEAETVRLDRSICTQEFIAVLERYNENDSVSGILIFRPMPEHIDEKEVARAVSPQKDVDCMNPLSMAKVFVGEKNAIPPSTPEAVIELLKHYFDNNTPGALEKQSGALEKESGSLEKQPDILEKQSGSLEKQPDILEKQSGILGKHVVIINRSVVLGKALAMLFLQEDATVTICHSKTKNIKEITRAADIIITGVGRAKYFDKDYFTDKSIVIDVGINFDESGNMCGDVDTDDAAHIVKWISPVPGGVGFVTTAVLLRHVLQCYYKINEKMRPLPVRSLQDKE